MGRSINLEVSVSFSLGRASRLKKPPGILPTEYRFSTDEVALRTIYRVDGNLPLTTAIAYLVSANT